MMALTLGRAVLALALGLVSAEAGAGAPPAASRVAWNAPAGSSLSTSNGLAADPEGRIRTQLSSRNAVTVSAELSARIANLSWREGDAFQRGQVLVSFDCSLYQSQLRKVEAGAELADAALQSNRRLAELQSVGKFEVDQAQARLKEAQAEIAGGRAVVNRCAIAAPFNGRVARRHAATHGFVSPGTPLLDIVETSQLELQMIVPSKWLVWLKPGAAFSVAVDELGRSYPARVLRLGAQIDPVSQSISVVGAIDGTQPGLLPGMSGWAAFPARP